ncbi:hypothetical protein SNEBB_002115 [Seison nebaliae]|nr:hypothetical protein SNEBB_002115 [Seison nebaliae]
MQRSNFWYKDRNWFLTQIAHLNLNGCHACLLESELVDVKNDLDGAFALFNSSLLFTTVGEFLGCLGTLERYAVISRFRAVQLFNSFMMFTWFSMMTLTMTVKTTR